MVDEIGPGARIDQEIAELRGEVRAATELARAAAPRSEIREAVREELALQLAPAIDAALERRLEPAIDAALDRRLESAVTKALRPFIAAVVREVNANTAELIGELREDLRAQGIAVPPLGARRR